MGVHLRVCIIADIHGNMPALRAILATLPTVDLIICCGDIVGYYPDINEVCDLLRQKQVLAVRGNHDSYLIGKLLPDPMKEKVYQIEWARAHLIVDHFQWIGSLPIEVRIKLGTLKLIIRHASLWDEETYLYPDAQILNSINLSENELLLIGHTHRPMLAKSGKGTILNPGSVGQPRDWIPLASYGLLETDTQEVKIIRVEYDVSEFQKRLTKLNWNENLIQILSRTR